MKKTIISVILVLCIAVVPLTAFARYLGDINNDNEITASDARKILRFSASLETLTDEQQKYADLDGNGEVNAKDARLALRTSAGLVAKIDKDESQTEPSTSEEPSTDNYENYELPRAIKAFFESNYDMTATLLGEKLRVATDGTNTAMSMNGDSIGFKGDMTIIIAKKKKGRNKTETIIYMMLDDKKVYLEMTEDVMSSFNMSPDEFAELAVDFKLAPDMKLYDVKEEDGSTVYRFKASDGMIYMYMNGDDLTKLELLDQNGKVLETIDIESFIPYPPASTFTVPSNYKKTSMLALMTLLGG